LAILNALSDEMLYNALKHSGFRPAVISSDFLFKVEDNNDDNGSVLWL